VAADRRKKGDTELVMALAYGASPEHAAHKAGLSRRTVYRRLADPAFRARVTDLRADLARRTAGMITAAGLQAVKTLTTLQESATAEAVRLGAARAMLDLGCKLREHVEWAERLAGLEASLQALLGTLERPGTPDAS
jgi:hypothetical protein